MNIALIVDQLKDQQVFDILENAQSITVAGPLPAQYDIDILMRCLKCRYLYEHGDFYRLTTTGAEFHWKLVDTLFAVRSANNNVFRYCAYWGSWSRVLWHESDQKLKAAIGFEVRASSFVELNLTAINPHDKSHWESHVQHGTIRTHGTTPGHSDKFVGSLPGHVVYTMRKWLTDDAVDKLIHADYLPFIDFEKGRKASNGGFKFADATKEFMSIERYAALLRITFGAGPGLLTSDVREDYEQEKKVWEAKRDALIITKGMRDAED